MTDFFNTLGRLFEVSFHYIEKLNNTPNIIIITICFVAAVLWIRRMIQYNKEAEQSGSLK